MLYLVDKAYECSLRLDDKLFVRRPKLALVASGCFATLAAVYTAYRPFTLGCSLFLGLMTLYKWKHIVSHIAFEMLHLPYSPSLNHRFAFFRERYGYATLDHKVLNPDQIVPTLDLTQINTAECWGYHQGVVLGEQIWRLYEQALPLMFAEAAKERNDPHQSQLDSNVKNLSINDDERSELQGLSMGCQKWGKDRGVEIDQVALYNFLHRAHVLPDTYKAIGSGSALKMGCSTIVWKDPISKKFMAARSLDWVSLGTLGTQLHSKLYNVTLNDKVLRIWSHTMPGFIGCATCANSEGLIAIVNELGVTAKGFGTPYSLYVKRLIESCISVEDVEKCIVKFQADQNSSAASSFSLTVIDNATAALFHFYPGGVMNELQSVKWDENAKLSKSKSLPLKRVAQGVFKRALPEDGTPLVVTNHAYTKHGRYIKNSVCDGTSRKRCEAIWDVYSENPSLDLEIKIKKMLQAASETATIGVYIFDIYNGTVQLGNDNYNAGALIPFLKSGTVL